MIDADVAARELQGESLRAAAEARLRIGPAAELVHDTSGGDPIAYEDEQEGPDRATQYRRDQRDS